MRIRLRWIPGKQLPLTSAAKYAQFNVGKKGNIYLSTVISTAKLVRSMLAEANSMSGERVGICLPPTRLWNWLLANTKFQAPINETLASLRRQRIGLKEYVRSGSTRIAARFSFCRALIFSLEILEEFDVSFDGRCAVLIFMHEDNQDEDD